MRLLHLFALLIVLGGCPGGRSGSRPTPAACDDKACVQTLYDRKPVLGAPKRGLVVDEKHVYWAEVTGDGQRDRTTMKVMVAPKTGAGPVRALDDWDDMQSGSSLAIDEAAVYWLANAQLVRAPKDGSAITRLTVPDWKLLDAGPIADAGDAVVVGGHGCLHLARVPKDGSAGQRWPVSTRPVTGGSTGLHVDGSLYYCASGNHVHVLDARTGQATELVAYGGRAGPIRKVGQDLYWLDYSHPDTKQPSLFMLAGGAGQPVALGPGHGQANSLLYDDSRDTLYWMTGLGHDGCVLATLSLKDKQSGVLLENQGRFANTAQDEDFIYWGTGTAILRVHK